MPTPVFILILAALAVGILLCLIALRYDSGPARHRLGSIREPYRPVRRPPVDDVLGRAMAFEYEDLSGAFETTELAAVA